MSYTIYKTNGLQLLTLLDGTLNDKYGIKLVGKNYINYGTAQNENFVYLQENFANDTAPIYPLTGQLWYNTQSNTVSFFDGVTFNALANVAQLGSGIDVVNTALIANAAILQTAIKANVAIQTANAGVQSDAIANLLANAGVQSDAIGAINANVTAANVNISTLQTTATTLTTKTDSTNSNVAAVVGNVAILQGNVVALFANAATQGAAITAIQSAGYITTAPLSAYATLNSPTFTGTVSGITKAMVGLGDVTNESKATMFTSPTFTGSVNGITKSMVGLGEVTNESKATMFTSPVFTTSPTAPTQSYSDNSTKLATTAWVLNATQYWDGSRKYVSNSAPTSGDGANGDFWFQYQ
jgi:hypothetical protein